MLWELGFSEQKANEGFTSSSKWWFWRQGGRLHQYLLNVYHGGNNESRYKVGDHSGFGKSQLLQWSSQFKLSPCASLSLEFQQFSCLLPGDLLGKASKSSSSYRSTTRPARFLPLGLPGLLTTAPGDGMRQMQEAQLALHPQKPVRPLLGTTFPPFILVLPENNHGPLGELKHSTKHSWLMKQSEDVFIF